MKTLIFLVHRIPFPPNKGDKIRSFHVLRHLSKRYKVHLGYFVDTPGDERYLEDLQKYCVSIKSISINRRFSAILSLVSLITGKSMSQHYYWRGAMSSWVRHLFQTNEIDYVVAFSSVMAQYFSESELGRVRSVVDLVDVDSAKWEQYATERKFPMRQVYLRESSRLLAYEKSLRLNWDLLTFVSTEEAELFTRLAGSDEKISWFNNGVDYSYFDPSLDMISPYSQASRVIVFTGAMDYWANAQAIVWFVNNIFEAIQRYDKSVSLYIVGAAPLEEVRALARQNSSVTVTGSVADIRPYILYATLVVAPLQIARGVQNKVLEALALGKPVAASAEAIQGIQLLRGDEVTLCHGADDYLEAYKRSSAEGQSDNQMRRNVVLKNYDWERNVGRLTALLETGRVD